MSREEEIIQEANTQYGVNHPFIDIAKESFIEGAQWAYKTMIDKACNWLKQNAKDYVVTCYDEGELNDEDLLNDFKKSMDESI